MRAARVVMLFSFLSVPCLTLLAQEPTQSEAQDLLRQASALIPEVPEAQQMSVASNIANAQTRAGNVTDALRTVLFLRKPEAQAQALGSVAYFLDYSGDTDAALKLIAMGIKGQTTDASYEQIAWAHARKGDFAEALRVAHHIEGDPGRLVEALNGIAQEQWKSGDHAGAQSSWDEATQVASKNPKDLDPAFLLISVATSRAQAGETAAASASFHALYSEIEQRDPPDEGLRTILAGAFAQIDELTSAMDVIKTLPPGGNRDMSLSRLAEQYAIMSDPDDAEKVASRISDAHLESTTLSGIAHAEADAGRPGSAVEQAEKIATPSGQADALSNLALQQSENDDSSSRGTLELASAAANESAATTPEYVFATIAVTYAKLGDYASAVDMGRRLSPNQRWWVWQTLTTMSTSDGKLRDALDLITTEKDAYPKACALLGAANGILWRLRHKDDKK